MAEESRSETTFIAVVFKFVWLMLDSSTLSNGRHHEIRSYLHRKRIPDLL